MIKILDNRKLVLIIAHLVLGFLATLPLFSMLYGHIAILLGVAWVLISNNRNEEAILMASYVVGMEVFLRMTDGLILYETGKYSIFLFLILGLSFKGNTNKPNVLFVFYVLLLLLGIVFTSVPHGESIRNAIAFNLSGPILLGFCAFYFNKRRITRDALYRTLLMMILPIFSMVSYLYFKTPNIEEIVFGTSANFDASGGFGPNQVATILGLGIFITAVFLMSKKTLTGYVLIDVLMLIYLVYRGLLTFSRGGVITGVVAFAIFLVFYVISQRKGIVLSLKIIGVFIGASVAIWLYTSNITGGMINNRYLGRNDQGVQKKDITTGRLDILQDQFLSFYNSPIYGIGVGNGKYKRLSSGNRITAASHNEVGRLVEEHGLIGILSLFILLGVPFFEFRKVSSFQKAFLLAFFILWLLTIGHSAMRIAFPSFIYGLCLISIVDEE